MGHIQEIFHKKGVEEAGHGAANSIGGTGREILENKPSIILFVMINAGQRFRTRQPSKLIPGRTDEGDTARGEGISNQ